MTNSIRRRLNPCESTFWRARTAQLNWRLREASQFVRQLNFQDITDAELERVHAAIPEMDERNSFRLYASVAVAAASVLIVQRHLAGRASRAKPADGHHKRSGAGMGTGGDDAPRRSA